MNQDNQNPEITNPSSTNSYSNSNIPSGFTPANAIFNGDSSSTNVNNNSGVLNNLSAEAIEDMEVQKTEVINRNLDNQLGLVYPSDMQEEEQILYKAFFGIMRNMYKWEMLTAEYVSGYYQKFQPLNLSQKQTINRDLEEIYRAKQDENLLLQQYFDVKENDEAWQDLFDSLDAEGQEKLIYYAQTGQQMPADILAKVKAQLASELEGEEVTDQEASAFAQKNIQKILSRGGFSASTLTSKDISDIVNSGSNNSAANPSSQPRPISPQIPVRVPQRVMPPVNSNLNSQQLDNSGLGQSNNQNFAGNTNNQVTNNQNNFQPSQLGQQFSNNNAGNNFSNQQQSNQSQNVLDTMPFDQAKNLMGNTQFNQPRNSNNSNQNFNSDQNTGSKLQNLPGGRSFPKPIGGISHPPKGLNELLNNK